LGIFWGFLGEFFGVFWGVKGVKEVKGVKDDSFFPLLFPSGCQVKQQNFRL
jgi:hypothetical protein